MTNSPVSLFLDGDERRGDGQPLGLRPLEVRDGALWVRAGAVPAALQGDIRALLAGSGEAARAGKVAYYTGRISTQATLGLRYGYFEARARIPRGKGRWPAFWLAPAGQGWPPEIDVFEAYGAGISGPTDHDNMFNTALWFDEIDIRGTPGQNVAVTNPFDTGPSGRPAPAETKAIGGKRQYRFGRTHRVDPATGVSIYDDFMIYAVHWTTDHVAYYFGPSRDSLVEIYRAPTPEDLRSPMAMIANDQVGSDWGWLPRRAEHGAVFAPGNAFVLDYIRAYAPPPRAEIAAVASCDPRGADPLRIVGTPADEAICAGLGQNVITLGGGRDHIVIAAAPATTIIYGFGPDDRITLAGSRLRDAGAAAAALTEVGPDLWLIDEADPFDPQTLIFKGLARADLGPENIRILWPVTRDIWARAGVRGARLRDLDGDAVVRAAPEGSKLTDAPRSATPKRLIGSAAGDLYFVYFSETRIIEKPRAGVDTATVYADFTLPANVENLRAAAGRGLKLIGNDAENRIEAGPGHDRIAGGGGDDLIDLTRGGGDVVYLRPGDGNDRIAGFAADDRLALRRDLAGSGAPMARLEQLPDGVRLTLGPGTSVFFSGIGKEELTWRNFSVFDTGNPGL